ncbi:hypothetical protein DL765_008986 [Monosporascus sp. GIB2]|nr:hypothetical protein DL765_008986 [Monosporascus sp. GIB2]
MSSSCHSSLAEGSIRLLRLLPRQDEHSPIQCQLFDCPLLDSENTYPYEALSYVWGSEDKPYAICIDQGNPSEKGLQVQSMAKIYAKASRVIVWLGGTADDGDQALEKIRIAAAEQSTKSPINRVNPLDTPSGPSPYPGTAFGEELRQKAILTLLQRPWFQRIWVREQMLDIATERRDKVYALLGMSSDPNIAGLSADYEISWRQLFQRLVNFLISDEVSVDTWDDKEIAIIKGKGCVLGEVSSVKRDIDWEDRQNVDITWNAPRYFGMKEKQTSRWTFQASAKSIQVGDAVCLLQGASKPTIIRLHNSYCAVIMVAVPPTDDLPAIRWSGLVRSITAFPHGFLLIWDWDMYPDKSQDGENYEYFMNHQMPKCSNTMERCLKKATRLRNIGLILQDMERDEEAEKSLQKGIEAFEKALSSEDNLELTYPGHGRWIQGDGEELKLLVDELIKDSGVWTPLWLAVANGHEAVVNLLLGTGEVDPDAKDNSGRTPLGVAAENGYETIVKLLFDTGKADLNAKDNSGRTPLRMAAGKGHEAVVKLLLDTGKVDPDAPDSYGETPLMAAASEGHEAVVKLLLDTGKVDPDTKDYVGRTPLRVAAKYAYEAVVKLLLDTGKDDPDAKDYVGRTPLWVAAKCGHEAVVKLLLDTGKVDPDAPDRFGETPLKMAARYGREAVVKLLQSLS